MRKIKFRYWNPLLSPCGVMVNEPEMPHKKGWTITQLFSDRGWIWMQYTGLQDRNGKEIWEGDVVKQLITQSPQDLYLIKEVSFITGCFCVPVGADNTPTKLGWIAPSCLEVIGNIYENPELLVEDKG